MTALEMLYKQHIEATGKPMEEFYDTFKNDCPYTFFDGVCNLCDVRQSDFRLQMCVECWSQEV